MFSDLTNPSAERNFDMFTSNKISLSIRHVLLICELDHPTFGPGKVRLKRPSLLASSGDSTVICAKDASELSATALKISSMSSKRSPATSRRSDTETWGFSATLVRAGSLAARSLAEVTAVVALSRSNERHTGGNPQGLELCLETMEDEVVHGYNSSISNVSTRARGDTPAMASLKTCHWMSTFFALSAFVSLVVTAAIRVATAVRSCRNSRRRC
ncbi:hypothetical protein DFH07DRAFT_378762 [Mycena maculata]|uniref:Uncharacterized protein n=1 Tax=Mycena maculata TaxID=230809 RepID=A0AAD7JJF9_9AGAR|nr:hypothetical protein DFH07DRAFT_378762 [Mycena maculata]